MVYDVRDKIALGHKEYELLDPISALYITCFESMGKVLRVEFQMYPLKFTQIIQLVHCKMCILFRGAN